MSTREDEEQVDLEFSYDEMTCIQLALENLVNTLEPFQDIVPSEQYSEMERLYAKVTRCLEEFDVSIVDNKLLN